MSGISVTIGPHGTRYGCMFCGTEIDYKANHETTGNFGCVSATNPARKTVRRVERVEYVQEIVHFDLAEDAP